MEPGGGIQKDSQLGKLIPFSNYLRTLYTLQTEVWKFPTKNVPYFVSFPYTMRSVGGKDVSQKHFASTVSEGNLDMTQLGSGKPN